MTILYHLYRKYEKKWNFHPFFWNTVWTWRLQVFNKKRNHILDLIHDCDLAQRDTRWYKISAHHCWEKNNIKTSSIFFCFLPKGLESELMKFFPMSKRLCPILVFNIIWPKLNLTSAGAIFSVKFSIRFEIGEIWNFPKARLTRFYNNFNLIIYQLY